MTPSPLGAYCTVLYPVQVAKAQVTGTYNLIPPSTGQNKRKLIAARFPQVWWSHTPQQQASETGTARVGSVSEHSFCSCLTKAHPLSTGHSCSCWTTKLGWSTLVFVPIPVFTVYARLDAKVDCHGGVMTLLTVGTTHKGTCAAGSPRICTGGVCAAV
jgi:hypothetical protein